jgi:hypothetical protein
MCCAIVALSFFGPRVALLVFWFLPAGRALFDKAFNGYLIPILGVIFLPWTALAWTLFYGNNGIAGMDWLWVGLGLVADITTYTSGAAKRKSVPGYPNSAP